MTKDQTSQTGETKPTDLDIQGKTLKTVEPIRRHSIALDIQNKKWVDPGSLTSMPKTEVKILKIVKPTQLFDHFQHSKLRSQF